MIHSAKTCSKLSQIHKVRLRHLSQQVLLLAWCSCMHIAPEGVLPYKEVGGAGGLAPNFASETHVGAPNFASKNIGNHDRYPKFCPLNFRYNPKCPQNCDSFPIFASCSDRSPQIFPLIQGG